PAAVLQHFVVIAGRTDLGRAAIGKIAAGCLCVGPHQFRIELRVPAIVTVPVVALRRQGRQRQEGHCASDDELHEPVHCTTSLGRIGKRRHRARMYRRLACAGTSPLSPAPPPGPPPRNPPHHRPPPPT